MSYAIIKTADNKYNIVQSAQRGPQGIRGVPGASIAYGTQAEMFADLAHNAATWAWVMADAGHTAENPKNGYYYKIGESGTGSWVGPYPMPVPTNSVGATELKVMKWAENSGIVNFNTTDKTVTVIYNMYVWNDDGLIMAQAGTVAYDDSSTCYICINKETGVLFTKSFNTPSTAADYILYRILGNKIYNPFGYKGVQINGVSITGTHIDNAIGTTELKLRDWAEITVGDVKLDINTASKTVSLNGNVYVYNVNGFVLAQAVSLLPYIDGNTALVCVNATTGVLYISDIMPSPTSYCFVLCSIYDGKVFCPYGYKQILVDGSNPTANNTNFEAPTRTIKRINLSLEVDTRRLHTLADAWNAWRKGEKFPVGFIGPSTTESDTTANPPDYNVLGTDHISQGAYCTVLETLIRAATGNSVARIYNMGFSSKNAAWSLVNIEAMIASNPYYSDVKMIGICHGINDSLVNSSTFEYIDSFRTAMRGIIEWCFNHNIQPFLVTPQATTIQIPLYSPGYTSADMVNFSLSVIRELAAEYNLELIDNHTYTKVLQLKTPNLATLVPDGLHYKTEGHLYEAGLLFSEFNKETINLDKTQRVGFTNPEVRSELAQCSKLSNINNGFNSCLTTTASGVVYKVNLFNAFKYDVTMDFVFASDGDFVANVNGVNYTLNTANHTVTVDGMGLIQISVTNTSPNSLTFYGVDIS